MVDYSHQSKNVGYPCIQEREDESLAGVCWEVGRQLSNFLDFFVTEKSKAKTKSEVSLKLSDGFFKIGCEKSPHSNESTLFHYFKTFSNTSGKN